MYSNYFRSNVSYQRNNVFQGVNGIWTKTLSKTQAIFGHSDFLATITWVHFFRSPIWYDIIVCSCSALFVWFSWLQYNALTLPRCHFFFYSCLNHQPQNLLGCHATVFKKGIANFMLFFSVGLISGGEVSQVTSRHRFRICGTKVTGFFTYSE